MITCLNLPDEGINRRITKMTRDRMLHCPDRDPEVKCRPCPDQDKGPGCPRTINGTVTLIKDCAAEIKLNNLTIKVAVTITRAE